MELTLTKLIHQEPEKRNPHKTFLSALSIASPPQRTLLSLSVPSSRPAQQILRLLDLRHASSAPTHDWPPSWTSRTRMQLCFSSSTPSFLNLCPAVLLWMKRKPIKKINYGKKKKDLYLRSAYWYGAFFVQSVILKFQEWSLQCFNVSPILSFHAFSKYCVFQLVSSFFFFSSPFIYNRSLCSFSLPPTPAPLWGDFADTICEFPCNVSCFPLSEGCEKETKSYLCLSD